MYDYNSNVAYDLSRFDTEYQAQIKPKKESAPEIKVHEKAAARNGNWFKMLIVTACATFFAIALLISKATISELATKINEQEAQLAYAQSENVRLQANLDNMVTLNKVDQSAVNELGLQKTQKTQVRYIEGSTETLSEVAEVENNFFVSINEWFNGILEYLGF